METSRNPFFSIIIPTYNRKKLLRLAVESTLNQSFKDFELIIIDDGSKDKTNELIQTYRDSRLTYIYQENKGPSLARNKGINKSKGEFICFLDSDDRFRQDKLEQTYSYIKKYPQYKIFHTEEFWYRNGKYLPQKNIHKKPTEEVFLKAIKICCISLSTACLKKEIFKNIGLFDKYFPVCEDYEFWLRATLNYKVKLIPEYLTIKEAGHPGQQSSKKGLDKYRFLALEKLLNTTSVPDKYIPEILENIKKKAYIYTQGAEKRNKTKESITIKRKLEKIINQYES